MANQITFHVSAGEGMLDLPANLELGTKLNIKGRIQSREYYKHDENGNKEETPRIAYEVSACYIAKSKDDLDDEQGV